MKAIDYFNEYKIKREELGEFKAMGRTMIALFSEIGEIKTERKTITDRALISISEEVNQKSNSLIRMINKEKGENYYKNNAFKLFIQQEMLDLAEDIGWRE